MGVPAGLGKSRGPCPAGFGAPLGREGRAYLFHGLFRGLLLHGGAKPAESPYSSITHTATLLMVTATHSADLGPPASHSRSALALSFSVTKEACHVSSTC